MDFLKDLEEFKEEIVFQFHRFPSTLFCIFYLFFYYLVLEVFNQSGRRNLSLVTCPVAGGHRAGPCRSRPGVRVGRGLSCELALGNEPLTPAGVRFL